MTKHKWEIHPKGIKPGEFMTFDYKCSKCSAEGYKLFGNSPYFYTSDFICGAKIQSDTSYCEEFILKSVIC